MFKGRRTYMTAGGLVLASVAGYLTGQVDLAGAIMGGLNGLALIFLRNSIVPK